MAKTSNLQKRSYGYYWRRSLIVGREPINLTLSLNTKVHVVAVRRCALMTAKSEDVRMSLYKRVGEGLTPPQKWGIFRAELTAYRNGIRQEVLRWEDAPEPEELCSTVYSLRMLRELWGHISNEGVPHGAIDDRYLRQNLPELEPLERQGLAIVLEKITNFRGGLQLEVASRIAAEGASSTPTTLPLGTRLVAAARAQAVHEILLGVYVSPFDQALEQDESAIAEFTSEPATAAPCGEVAPHDLPICPNTLSITHASPSGSP
jgi:hypothetical protein